MAEAKKGYGMISFHEKLTVSEAILNRRSVREYQSREIDSQTIRVLLESAIHAPTAMHHEPWGFVVIQDRRLLRELSDYAKPRFVHELHLHASKNQDINSLEKIFSSPDFNIFYNAGTLIIICGKSDAAFYVADCWMAAENLMLAACSLELGTCIIGSALSAINTKEIKARLQIPENYLAVAPVIVGYPLKDTSPTPRNKPLILSSFKPSDSDLAH